MHRCTAVAANDGRLPGSEGEPGTPRVCSAGSNTHTHKVSDLFLENYGISMRKRGQMGNNRERKQEEEEGGGGHKPTRETM